MRGHNICFIEEILKIIPVTPSYLEPCGRSSIFVSGAPVLACLCLTIGCKIFFERAI